MVEKSSKWKIGVGLAAPYYNAILVGYGGLKIMSDGEIKKFKDRYITYLKNVKKIDAEGDEKIYGFSEGGVNTTNEYVINFLEEESKYWNGLRNDGSKLKLSHCRYSSTGLQVGCQGWGGSSGGPIFDDRGDIMGIHTRGGRVIGGSRHAGSESWYTADDRNSIIVY
jgi:V8-like Glu-specific endopeptidase